MTGAKPLVNVAEAVAQHGDGRVPPAGRPRARISGDSWGPTGDKTLRADHLLIEAPPDSAAWEAVRDRLARATGRGDANGNIGVAIL